jgi:hyaluronan synthase
MALIKIRALMTIRAQKWGTRQVAVENGQIVRTEGAGGGLDEQATIPMRAVARAGRAA